MLIMIEILGFPIDHSFLNYKKELLAYGYTVGKISLKDQTVKFEKEVSKDEYYFRITK